MHFEIVFLSIVDVEKFIYCFPGKSWPRLELASLSDLTVRCISMVLNTICPCISFFVGTHATSPIQCASRPMPTSCSNRAGVLQGAAFDVPHAIADKMFEQVDELTNRGFHMDRPKSLPLEVEQERG